MSRALHIFSRCVSVREILLVGNEFSRATDDRFLSAAILKKIFKSLNARFFRGSFAENCMVIRCKNCKVVLKIEWFRR